MISFINKKYLRIGICFFRCCHGNPFWFDFDIGLGFGQCRQLLNRKETMFGFSTRICLRLY